MKHLVVLFAALLFVGCSSSEKKHVSVDETKVHPAMVAAKDRKNEWKYSSDCKTWVAQDAFATQYESATVKPQYTYEQLITNDPGMNEDPRLLQYNSKSKIIVGDNMTFLTQFTEVTPPKDKSHNPIVRTDNEFMARGFSNQISAFKLTSQRLLASELNATLGWLRDSRQSSWQIQRSEPSGQLTLLYAFSKMDEDKLDAKNLSSRYTALICSKENCRLIKNKSGDVILDKKSIELGELRDLEGFNWNMISEIDQMCAGPTRTQFVKQLLAERDEYAKNCKVILSDDAIVRKWGELCRSYKEQIRPVASALF